MLQKHHFSDIQTSEEASEGTSEAKFGGSAKFRIAIKYISGFITDDRILFFQTSDQTSDQTSEASSEDRSKLRLSSDVASELRSRIYLMNQTSEDASEVRDIFGEQD